MSLVSDRVGFTCNGAPVEVETGQGETLLTVLRERLGLTSVKDGCAPQGQCGCCTVLVDGEPRVACVTPATRVQGRAVTTVDGLDAEVRDRIADAFVACGGSQCGFCTPGIVVRAAALLAKQRAGRVALDRALAAHLCRCTGWQTIYDAIELAARSSMRAPSTSQVLSARIESEPTPAGATVRDLDAAAVRAGLEGGTSQVVGADIVLGGGGFADDVAPGDSLVAVSLPPGSDAATVDAAGQAWVVAESLAEARSRAAKVQGRRTTIDARPPLPLDGLPTDGVRLRTSWVEPGYLEPDASWCAPGSEPATPLANGGAFGGKESSLAPVAARELSARLGRPVRVVFSREDVVRLGPKRAPIAATAWLDGSTLRIRGRVVAGPGAGPFVDGGPSGSPYALELQEHWDPVDVPGPPTAAHLRAAGLAERAVLLEGALAVAGADRAALLRDERASAVLLDTCVVVPSGARAGARVLVDPSGAVERVVVRVAAGDPLDEVVLRSYAIGGAHMGLGWVLSEELAVDETGEVHDLTIRSFGVIKPKDTPPIDVEIVPDAGPPLARASDAVFAAVAGAAWNAISAARGRRPESFPVR